MKLSMPSEVVKSVVSYLLPNESESLIRASNAPSADMSSLANVSDVSFIDAWCWKPLVSPKQVKLTYPYFDYLLLALYVVFVDRHSNHLASASFIALTYSSFASFTSSGNLSNLF